MGNNFSLMASAILVKDFAQTNLFVWICTNHKRVCLDMYCFYSFDNWLCDPISANWQLTLHGIISKSNIWRYALKMQLARFLISSFEYCMERNACLQPKWCTFNLVIFT